MTNTELWESYDKYTSDLSTVSRTLAFGSIAICWLFRAADNTIPQQITLALGFAISFFIFDFLQYLVGALIHRIWIRRNEKESWEQNETLDFDIEKPVWIDRPSFILWIVKLTSIFTSYIILIVYAVSSGILR